MMEGTKDGRRQDLCTGLGLFGTGGTAPKSDKLGLLLARSQVCSVDEAVYSPFTKESFSLQKSPIRCNRKASSHDSIFPLLLPHVDVSASDAWIFLAAVCRSVQEELVSLCTGSTPCCGRAEHLFAQDHPLAASVDQSDQMSDPADRLRGILWQGSGRSLLDQDSNSRVYEGVPLTQ